MDYPDGVEGGKIVRVFPRVRVIVLSGDMRKQNFRARCMTWADWRPTRNEDVKVKMLKIKEALQTTAGVLEGTAGEVGTCLSIMAVRSN